MSDEAVGGPINGPRHYTYLDHEIKRLEQEEASKR